MFDKNSMKRFLSYFSTTYVNEKGENFLELTRKSDNSKYCGYPLFITNQNTINDDSLAYLNMLNNIDYNSIFDFLDFSNSSYKKEQIIELFKIFCEFGFIPFMSFYTGNENTFSNISNVGFSKTILRNSINKEDKDILLSSIPITKSNNYFIHNYFKGEIPLCYTNDKFGFFISFNHYRFNHEQEDVLSISVEVRYQSQNDGEWFDKRIGLTIPKEFNEDYSRKQFIENIENALFYLTNQWIAFNAIQYEMDNQIYL